MWCRSCGLESAATPCSNCNTPIEGPSTGADWVGVVVKVSGGLLAKTGIALPTPPTPSPGASVPANGVSVLVKGTEPTVMEPEAFYALERIVTPGPEMSSAPGRLMAALAASDRRDVKAKWDRELVAAAAMALAQDSWGSRRAAAADWLLLSLDDEVQELGLTESELVWIRALLAARQGDVSTTIAQLGLLPSDGYGERANLLLSMADQILPQEDLHTTVAALLEPFAAERADGRALVAALGDTTPDEPLAATRALIGTLRPMGSDELARLADGIDGELSQHPSEPEEFAATQALAVYRSGMSGEAVDDDAGWLIAGHLALYDDLIDRGTLSDKCLANVRLLNDPLHYVTARLDPARLDDGQLQAMGHVAELARRAYTVGDARTLAQLPAEHEAVRHYKALLDVKETGDARRENLRSEARQMLEELDAYRAELKEAPGSPPPGKVLNDPSCWAALAQEARAGRIALSADLRQRAPDFAAWLDLCEIESCIWALDWTEARNLSDALLQRVTDERLSDEIQNMAAYAQYQLNNETTALRLLESALQGRFSMNLVINTSVVASELGSEMAAPILVQVYEEAADPAVGIRALSKAIGLWLDDDQSETPPPSLVGALRNALARPLPDDSHLTFVRFAANHDQEWLAGDPPINAKSQAQKDVSQFYETKVHALLPGHTESLTDVAARLVEIHRKTPVPSWAAQELEDMVGALMDGVHVPFGEAPGLASIIEVFLGGDVLTTPQALILGPQAGAHLAASFQESDGSTLSDNAERVFLFDPLDLYLREKASLPDGARESVGEELARCFGMAFLSLMNVTGNKVDQFGRAWEQLVQRESWDHQNRMSILRQERGILDEIGQWVKRCGRYNDEIRRLGPALGERKEMIDDFQQRIDRWSNEIARLRSLL